jgi:hypothetical protein
MAEPVNVPQMLRSIRDELERRLRSEPYPVLALALALGYAAGGGLFSRWTRPLARAAMGALLVPGFRERLRSFTSEPGRVEVTGAA